jgi:hypothetical protein
MADKNSAHSTSNNTPGTIVLQWLTYAFWGWTVVAIAYLAAVITSYVVGGAWVSDSIEPVAYGIAATLILLPFSVVCDWLYSKREKQDKQGIASVVMIVHAVLFALVAIGALISVAFSVVGLLLSIGDNTGSITAIVVSSVLVILYAILIARTVRPLIFAKFRLLFRVIMSVIAVAALTWGIIGPVTQAVITKDDRAVRDGLTSLNYAVNQYVSTNNELPATIQQVTNDTALLGSVYPATSSQTLNSLIDRNLITYTPNTKPSTDDTTAPVDIYSAAASKTHYYELCGVFAHDLKQRSWYSSYGDISVDSDGYGLNINEGAITAGTKCYKLSTSYYKQD